ncbi:MAG: prepilin-type N-terminal cleavage/methylation domain-containing protein [Candidatus Omnitrophica bacterium]|nr:prepilin-type N-terminal cleavage/methylation domain-containing protein [Candidatus Omnitrophota bacterium]
MIVGCALACFRVCPLEGTNAPTGQRANARTGFSLVELVISMAILSVGLVGAMRVFPVGLRASQRAEVRSRVVMVAQRTIESLKLKPWEELTEGKTTIEENGFEVTTMITASSIEHLLDPTRVKVVEVTVRPTQGIRDGRPFTFITYLRHRPS